MLIFTSLIIDIMYVYELFEVILLAAVPFSCMGSLPPARLGNEILIAT